MIKNVTCVCHISSMLKSYLNLNQPSSFALFQYWLVKYIALAVLTFSVRTSPNNNLEFEWSWSHMFLQSCDSEVFNWFLCSIVIWWHHLPSNLKISIDCTRTPLDYTNLYLLSTSRQMLTRSVTVAYALKIRFPISNQCLSFLLTLE